MAASRRTLSEALEALLDGAACALGLPVALLSRTDTEWRFEAEAFPPKPVSNAQRFRAPDGEWKGGVSVDVTDQSGSQWTGLLVGQVRQREWLLMLPGTSERWNGESGLDTLSDRLGRGLEAVFRLEDERHLADLHRRLYVFSRRLTRISDVAQTYRCILQTMARGLGAQTASLATYSDADQALAIVATYGYPLSIVEHVRIPPGHGVMGEAFTSARATVGRADAQSRRRRHATDSYMAVPLVASGRTLAVIALADRSDGQAFDSRDLASARLLAAPAALALARHRVAESLDELTRAATVDPVTGLFNRRYFETRIQAEVQRARRQQQDLALLMVDIDDFKRINDTFGHLEGDRALRYVADLLRRGVRIFDLCARYGGEEFAIVMPGASRQMAVQVAERIRRAMDDHSRLTPLPMTVSVGVGFLGSDQTEEDLISSADRALMAAKRAGKNVVKTD